MGFHVNPFSFHTADVFFKQGNGLYVRIGCPCFLFGQAHTLEDEVLLLVRGFDQQTYLASVERRLFNNGCSVLAQRVLIEFGFYECLVLVLCIAEEDFGILQLSASFCFFG